MTRVLIIYQDDWTSVFVETKHMFGEHSLRSGTLLFVYKQFPDAEMRSVEIDGEEHPILENLGYLDDFSRVPYWRYSFDSLSPEQFEYLWGLSRPYED